MSFCLGWVDMSGLSSSDRERSYTDYGGRFRLDGHTSYEDPSVLARRRDYYAWEEQGEKPHKHNPRERSPNDDVVR